MSEEIRGRDILTDDSAASADPGAPVDHGFPVTEETRTADGAQLREAHRNATASLPKPEFTLFHVLWLALTIGSTTLVVSWATRHGFGLLARIALGVVAFVASLIASHLAIVAVVVTIVIPHVRRGSPWEREVDGYMAAIFPGEWGRR